MSSDGKALAEWIELVPAGSEVPAIDGRKFRNPNPQRIVETFRAHHLDLPIDYEHSTQRKAPKGEESPAAGWIKDLEVREGALWGKVEWNTKGAASLSNREYRYISPAFYHDTESGIFQLESAGLTNKPALNQLAAVASQIDNGGHPSMTSQEKTAMELKDLLKTLGLDEKATAEQASAAIKSLQGAATELVTARAELAKSSAPDLSKFVPRADYDVVVARVATIEKSQAEEKAALLNSQVESEIDSALKAGKIAPASAAFYRAVCSSATGLAQFRDFVKTAPVIGGSTTLEKKPDLKDASVATPEELSIAQKCGLSAEVYLASKKALANAAVAF